MTEPRKTPRTEAQVVRAELVCPSSFVAFTESLEIETQELAKALCQMLLVISKQNIEAPGITKARVTLARHRAKQGGAHA